MCSGLASWQGSERDTGAVFPPTHPCGWQGPGASDGGQNTCSVGTSASSASGLGEHGLVSEAVAS